MMPDRIGELLAKLGTSDELPPTELADCARLGINATRPPKGWIGRWGSLRDNPRGSVRPVECEGWSDADMRRIFG